MKLDIWSSPDKIKKELKSRLEDSKKGRDWLERLWKDVLTAVYKNRSGIYDGFGIFSASFTPGGDGSVLRGRELTGDDEVVDEPQAYVNHIMRNLRYTHSQFSANPPVVIPRATSNDPEDKRRADAADRCIRYAIREYKMQETKDRAIWWCLVTGTAFIKCVWNPDLGEILTYDEDSGEMTMEGDVAVTNPSTWAVYPESVHGSWDDVRYVFERIEMPFEEAVRMFGEEKAEKIKMHPDYKSHNFEHDPSKVVTVYQYWEKGLPINGYQGRFCWCLSNGEPLTDLVKNPHGPMVRAKGPDGAEIAVRKAALPYHVITEIDMIESFWGLPLAAYSIALQEEMAQIDTVTLDAMRAMGCARIMVPESCEISGGMANTPWEIVKFKGSQPPFAQLATQPVSPVMLTMRDRMEKSIDDTHGINESMRGEQNREVSGFAMQYAVSQGNTIRQRFFTKYVSMIESLYKSYLQILQEHWTTARTIKVIGKEKAFEVVDIKGADLASGFDLVPEYGTSLPLDPMARQNMMVQYLPLFEKAGVAPEKILSMLKLADVGEVLDSLELAQDRQREIFEKMTKEKMYIKPDELQDHKGMLAWASKYVMTSEFRDLGPVEQQLIREHMKAREAMLVKDSTNPEGPASQVPDTGLPASPSAPVPQPQNLGELLGA